MISFMKSIELPAAVRSTLCDVLHSSEVQDVLCSEDYSRLLNYDTSEDAVQKIRRHLTDDADGFQILLIELMACMDNARREPWCGAWREYLIPTMKCFSRFVSEYHVSYGRYGFDRWWWVTRQINARLLRVGELEYEPDSSCREIHIHIPSDSSLIREKLDQSLEKARQIFAEELSEGSSGEGPWTFTCESWLLSPALAQLLPEDSRILQFQKYFSLQRVIPDADDYLEWVFKVAGGQKSSARPRELREDTSLQRNMKRFILSGGRVGVGIGTLSEHS